MSSAALTVKELHVAYGESKALFGIDMNTQVGEIVACVGRNGAGKTTLLRTIAGFLKPTSGSIIADSTNLVGLKAFAVAGMGIKYVPQDKKVFSQLTVKENLELGSYASGDYNWTPVTDYFPKLKLLMDRKAGNLSGGERQMLMIGRAILGAPKILLVDEPTEGLAPSVVGQLKEVFQDLAKKCTLVIVEQNLPLVCAIADRVYALNNGKIVAELADRSSIKPEICEEYL